MQSVLLYVQHSEHFMSANTAGDIIDPWYRQAQERLVLWMACM